MSEFYHTAPADYIIGDYSLNPLVAGLQRRHAKLTTEDSRTPAFVWFNGTLSRNDHEWLRSFGRKVIGRRWAA